MVTTKLDTICEHYSDEEFLSAYGFEDALIGVCGEKLVYSRKKCIDILIERDNMTQLDAIEYFNYNVEGTYTGEKTPIWVDDTMFD